MNTFTKDIFSEGFSIFSGSKNAEHWIHDNRSQLFKLHLEKEGLTWRKLSILLSEHLSTPIKTSDLVQIVNGEYMFSLNKRFSALNLKAKDFN
jgi:hypothetical protein